MPDLENSDVPPQKEQPPTVELTISRYGGELKILKDKSGKFTSKAPTPIPTPKVEAEVEEEPLPPTREMTREIRKYLYEIDPAYGVPRYKALVIKSIERAMDDNPKNALAAAKQLNDIFARWLGDPEPGDSEVAKGTPQGGNIVVRFDMKDFYPEGMPQLGEDITCRNLPPKQPSWIEGEVLPDKK